MKTAIEFASIAIACALFGAIWWVSARHLRDEGKGVLYRHIGGFIGGFLALVVYGTVIFGKHKQSEKMLPAASVAAPSPIASVPPIVPAMSAEKEKIKAEATLNLTPQQYAKRFNGFMTKMELPFKIKPIVTHGSERDTFKCLLNDYLSVIGTVDKASGKVSDVIFIGSGDGTPKSGANVMYVAVATLAAAVPEATIKNIAPEVMDMLQETAEDGKKSPSRTFSNVKLLHHRSKEWGIYFSAGAMD